MKNDLPPPVTADTSQFSAPLGSSLNFHMTGPPLLISIPIGIPFSPTRPCEYPLKLANKSSVSTFLDNFPLISLLMSMQNGSIALSHSIMFILNSLALMSEDLKRDFIFDIVLCIATMLCSSLLLEISIMK